MGYDLKFKVQQALVDSQAKFDFEKYMEDPTSKKTPQAQAVYQWYKQGDFNAPPPIEIDEFGQINAFDPATGTVGYVPAKQYNLPKLAEGSVFTPALEGYQLDPNQKVPLPTGETVYREQAVYNPQMVQGAISSLAGSQEFLGWKVDNAGRIRQAVQANPTADPAEVMYGLWEQDIMAMQPNKFKENIQQPQKAVNVNINMGNGDLTEQTAGYGSKPVFVYGFTAKKGEPLTYTSAFDGDAGEQKFQTTTIDGFTLGGQEVKISGGPNIKYLDNLKTATTGTIDMSLGDMMLVPVYKKGTNQIMNGQPVNISGVIIPDDMLEEAEKNGKVQYEVMIMGNQKRDGKTVYSPAEQVINNATFLKEDKVDKTQLKQNLEILKAKRDELNQKQGKSSGVKLTFVEWKAQNPNGTVMEYNAYKAQ
jgi:hypothetical protein